MNRDEGICYMKQNRVAIPRGTWRVTYQKINKNWNLLLTNSQ
jgi:hypothetical protein